MNRHALAGLRDRVAALLANAVPRLTDAQLADRLAALEDRAEEGDQGAAQRLARVHQLLTLARARRDAAEGNP